MASSSCALELRGAGPGRGLVPVREKRGGSSGRHRVGGNATWKERTRATAGALRSAGAAGDNATTAGLASADRPRASFSEEQPALAAAAAAYVDKMAEEKRVRREPVDPEKLDKLMRESIGEIVRNIGEAPFLVHIFSESGRGGGVRLEREAALPERWRGIKKRWDEESRTPDAVILVEEVEENKEEEEEAATTTWGLVAQGQGMEWAACYILDTTRVKSTMGFLTYFFIVRAKCFGEPVDVQLRNAALVR